MLKSVNLSENRLNIKRWERLWVENTFKLNIVTYWYYRYFTNEFELFIINNRELTK